MRKWSLRLRRILHLRARQPKNQDMFLRVSQGARGKWRWALVGKGDIHIFAGDQITDESACALAAMATMVVLPNGSDDDSVQSLAGWVPASQFDPDVLPIAAAHESVVALSPVEGWDTAEEADLAATLVLGLIDADDLEVVVVPHAEDQQ